MKKISILLLCVSVGICLGMIAMRSCKPKEIVTEIVQRDTLIVQRVDTIRIVEPKPYKVVVRDTIYITDTLVGSYFVHEVKEYIHPTFYARVSGINANLEDIKVYPKETIKYITTTEKVYEKPKKWGVGISAGYCVTTQGLQPYLGLGVTYNIWQF